MDVAVLSIGARSIGLRIGEITDDRLPTARRNPRRLLVVADERRHDVAAPHERVEHGAANVAGRAGQEDSHLEALQLTSGARQRDGGVETALTGASRKTLNPR